MTKRSALTMAGGLALSLLVGVVAMSLMVGGTSVANAGRQHKPIVKHQVETVTVHRKADTPPTGGIQVIHLSPSSASGSVVSAASSDERRSISIHDSTGMAFTEVPPPMRPTLNVVFGLEGTWRSEMRATARPKA